MARAAADFGSLVATVEDQSNSVHRLNTFNLLELLAWGLSASQCYLILSRFGPINLCQQQASERKTGRGRDGRRRRLAQPEQWRWPGVTTARTASDGEDDGIGDDDAGSGGMALVKIDATATTHGGPNSIQI
uniref:Uncharacterized protein n=1 Tax=Oryza brachyantha TaxID=4533 RepID=J3LC95_ORYBR